MVTVEQCLAYTTSHKYDKCKLHEYNDYVQT